MSTMGASGAALEGMVEALDRQAWLDPVAERLQGAVSGAFRAAGTAGQKVKNFLHGTWLGHPLHPVLTDIPLGAWTAALVFDVSDSMTGRRGLRPAADAAIGIGLIGAVGAAVSGLTDWQHTDAAARRTGVAHGFINTGAVLLFTTSLVLRRRGLRRGGRALSLLGVAVAGTAAYLGGSLVYRHRIGIDHAEGDAMPVDFVPVLAEGDLREDQPRRVEVNGARVLLVRHAGGIYALGETCSHLGGPLAEGRLEGENIICPWHGSRFALEDGHVLDGPATFPQPCLEARVRNGRIEVKARSHALARPLRV